MEFEISTKRRMENLLQSSVHQVVLYVLYGGICLLSQLDRRRLPLYQGAADLEVDNDGTVERTVSEIIRRLEL